MTEDYQIIDKQSDHKIKQIRQQTKYEKIKNMLTNSIYHLQGISIPFKNQKSEAQFDQCYIFGQKINNREDAFVVVKNTMWLTYRNNFPELLGESHTSDTGWGCMIRVGQMFLAQALKVHQKEYISHSISEESESIFVENSENILTAFLDDDQNKPNSINYSIQKIARIAKEEFKLEPGQWMTPSHISYNLEQLHNTQPLRGYDTMKLLVFNNNSIFYDQICTLMGWPACKCKSSQIHCPKCHKIKPKIQRAVTIILLSRIGLDKVNKEYKQVVMEILELKQSLGIVGGKPNKALYFLGKQSMDKLIYLDPHFVQPSTNRSNLYELKSTYQCTSYRTLEFNDIDPSLGFCFYLRNIDQLQDFYYEMKKINNKFSGNFFIYSEIKTPDYITKDLELEKSKLKSKISTIEKKIIMMEDDYSL